MFNLCGMEGEEIKSGCPALCAPAGQGAGDWDETGACLEPAVLGSV